MTSRKKMRSFAHFVEKEKEKKRKKKKKTLITRTFFLHACIHPFFVFFVNENNNKQYLK